MSAASWLRRRKSDAARSGVGTVRPVLERLEDRTVPSFASPVSYATGAGPLNVVTADFNNDGRPDLAVPNSGSNSVSVLLGNGDGTFQPAVNMSMPSPAALSAADFNGDGIRDLAVMGGDGLDASVLLGNGNGTFQPPITTPRPQNDQGFYLAIATGDFNNDGRTDLILPEDSYDHYSAVRVLLGNGNGSFTESYFNNSLSGSDSGPGYGTSSLGDFNGDGMTDVVVAYDNASPRVLFGNGDGTLNVGPIIAGGDSATVVVGDFNGDGHLDVASGGTSPSVILGNGNGTFQAPQVASIAPLAACDVNGDGQLDLVSGGGAAIGIQFGNGGGGFGPAQPFAVATDGYFNSILVVGQFNADTMPDVAAVNSSANTVSVLLNNADWPAPGSPTLSIGDASVLEGNSGTTAMSFTITLSAAVSQSVTVQYATQDGYATSGSDYLAASGMVTLAPGETSKTVAVVVNGDTTLEPNETFKVWLHDAQGVLVDRGAGTGTIVNDDLPAVSINDVGITEGNTGTRMAMFSVSLSVAATQTTTVQYATANGTAAAGSDYQSTSGTVTFAPGERVKAVSVPIIGDRLPEANETFFVNLSNAVNAGYADSQGVGTIVDDEPRISITDVAMTEGNSGTKTFMFTVSLSAAYDQVVTMSYQTTNGTATTGDHDYVSKTGTLTFNPGETQKTITITVNGDKKKESDENFYVDLTGNSSNSLFTKSRGIGTILNDD